MRLGIDTFPSVSVPDERMMYNIKGRAVGNHDFLLDSESVIAIKTHDPVVAIHAGRDIGAISIG
jgi:hypothetical protein